MEGSRKKKGAYLNINRGLDLDVKQITSHPIRLVRLKKKTKKKLINHLTEQILTDSSDDGGF